MIKDPAPSPRALILYTILSELIGTDQYLLEGEPCIIFLFIESILSITF